LDEISQGRYRQLLSRTLTRAEALTLNWVVENQIALETAESIGVTVVQYEKLQASPEVEWPRLCQALDLAKVPNRSLRERPSQQSAVGRPQGSGSSFEAPRWYRSLTQDQRDQVQGILDETQFNLYSMEEVDLKETTAKTKRVTSVLCQS
jgi:hypothetical protein